MIIEVTRLVHQWLQHPEYGVGAMVQTIDRMTAPDGVPDESPVIPDIYNDLDNDLSVDPPTSPALMVFTDSVANADSKESLRHTVQNLRVTVAYITRDMTPRRAALDGGYLMRAVKKSLTRYNDQVLSRGYRELNGIKVAACDRVAIHRVAGAVGRSQLWGFVQATLTVIDTDP